MNDGNFKAQNSHSGRPDQDVCLYDGEGYMVAEQPYQEYLLKVPSAQEVNVFLFPTIWPLSLILTVTVI